MKTYQNNERVCPCGEHKGCYSIQDTGWGKCFSCDKNFPPEKVDSENSLSKVTSIQAPDVFEKERPTLSPLGEFARPMLDRGINKETVARYKVNVDIEAKAFYNKCPLYDRETDEHVSNKVRTPDKRFFYEGSPKKLKLFGQHAFPAGSAKAITVTEGYEDAMAVYQMTGSQFPAVSVHGSSSAERDVRDNFEYLNSFEKIVFAFDSDEAGRKAAKSVQNIGFPIGKVRILTLRKFKDANEYLINKQHDAFSKEWWQAPIHKPDGLLLGNEDVLWNAIVDRKDSFRIPYPWDGLNKLTYGLRLSELVVLTADTGVGKTSVLKTIEHLILTNKEIKEKGYGIGLLHLEEPIGDTALGLLSIHDGVPYHLPDVVREEETLRKGYNEILASDRLVMYDHFGSNAVDVILDKVRHMAALGCKYIVLDHLSIIVSDQSGDERKQLDEITTKLKTLTMELDLSVIAVIHTNRQGQIRGTAGVEQLANIVLRLERDKTDPSEWRRNITRITVEKNRFCGYTGPACYLWYNKETNRLTQLNEEEVQAFEEKTEPQEDWTWTKN